MRRPTALALAALVAGCAPPPRAALGPVEIPAAPSGATATASPTASVAAAAPATPAATAPWVVRVERSATTTSVGRCQVGPVKYASLLIAECHVAGSDRVALRVIQDDERATGAQPAPGLLGKGYVIERVAGGLHVHGESGEPVPDDAVRRVRALSSAYLGWPAGALTPPLPPAGSEQPALEKAVAAIADVPLHGGEMVPATSADVRFTGTSRGDEGDELLLSVTVRATAADAGMCHRWSHEAALSGTLRLRATSGTLLALHLEGPTSDAEGLCQDPSGKPGPPPPPRRCNQGTITIDVRQPHAP